VLSAIGRAKIFENCLAICNFSQESEPKTQVKRRKSMILVGDIGGTNTRLALFEKGKMAGKELKYPSQKYKNLEAIIDEFLRGAKVTAASFGVAGPIRDGKCKITNLSWIIDSSNIAKTLKIKSVYLINDLEANAHGIKKLKKDELFCLQKGKALEGHQGLISAGTGLGEAGLFWDGKRHRPFPSEGGHSDFAPRDAKEVELLFHLQKKFGHVSYERVLSGPGIHTLFDFLIESGKEKLSPAVKTAFKSQDPTRVISEFACKEKDPACIHAIDWFISLYGAEAGNIALKFLTLGGLYIGGGIAPKLIERMKKGSFITSFTDKGRFKGLLETIPIYVILNDLTALLGAAAYAELMHE
jgi:glucokinase